MPINTGQYGLKCTNDKKVLAHDIITNVSSAGIWLGQFLACANQFDMRWHHTKKGAATHPNHDTRDWFLACSDQYVAFVSFKTKAA